MGRAVLSVKNIEKSNAADDCKPISSLPNVRKLFTGIVAESTPGKNGILPHNQKGFRGTKNQLLIDNTVLRGGERT